MRIAAFVLLGAALAVAFPSRVDARPYQRHGAYYRSTDGSWVHVPEGTGHHGTEVAICRDGTHSYSHHHRGTCSHHHGVARWE